MLIAQENGWSKGNLLLLPSLLLAREDLVRLLLQLLRGENLDLFLAMENFDEFVRKK